MDRSPVYLRGFGSFLPERIVSNAELAARIERPPEWIESASGIRERRWAEPGVTAADLAVAAAEDCLSRCSVSPQEVALVIVASGSASRGFPGPAAEVASRLGMGQTPAIDLPVASAGTITGLALACGMAGAGDVLVIGAETMSAVVGNPPLDPNTAILFGDGAGAALVSARTGPWRVKDAILHSDGEFRGVLVYDAIRLKMDGLSVILQASRKLPAVIREVLERTGIPVQDVAAFLMHQANLNLLTRVAKALEVPPERVYTNVQRYGNTSAASLLIAAAEWSAAFPATALSGPIVLAAFGAGLHWGALAAVPA